MSKPWFFLLLISLTASIALSSAEPEEAQLLTVVVRPAAVITDNQCLQVPTEHSYYVNKGWVIELDCGYLPTAACTQPLVSCTVTGNGVLKKSSLGVWSVSSGAQGGYATTAYFFKAKRSGQDTITLSIDGTLYLYQVFVQ